MGDETAIAFGQWDGVRRDFEASTLTDAAICRKHGITRDELWTRANKNRWDGAHRGFGLDRSILISQLLGVLDHQVARLEQMKAADMTEKEATVLGRLVTSLERLIELEGRAGANEGQHETREMRELRRKLAKRIEQLRRG